jgi:phospholipid transport system substrate-binding protein
VVNASFDFPTIARVVLGRVWGTLTDGERERFLAVFSELSVVTYAARFDSHTDERFVTLGSAPGRAEGEALVRTALQRPASGKPPVSLHYLLRRGPDGVWRVVNVVADGVSDLSLKRTEYAGILRGGNIASLIERLEAQIRDLLNGEAKA